MKIHTLKFKGEDVCDAVYQGCKTYEIRYNDRDYQVGDLIEPIALSDSVTPIQHAINHVTYKITYVSVGHPGVEDGYCVFGITPVEDRNKGRAESQMITACIE